MIKKIVKLIGVLVLVKVAQELTKPIYEDLDALGKSRH